jgi:hypothetical protein
MKLAGTKQYLTGFRKGLGIGCFAWEYPRRGYRKGMNTKPAVRKVRILQAE